MVLLKTETFDAFIEKSPIWINEYEEIKNEYNRIVNNLLKSWEGYGADMFSEDAKYLIEKINGLGDILNTMCDVLIDSRDVYDECDRLIGQANRDAIDQ